MESWSLGFGGKRAPVEGVGLDAADVVRLHAVQRVHELRQLALEPRPHAREAVAAPHRPARLLPLFRIFFC